MRKASNVSKEPNDTFWLTDSRREGYNPDSLKVELPFGNYWPNKVVMVGGIRVRVDLLVTPDIDTRLKKIAKVKQLGPTVKAIKKLATSRQVEGKGYLDDWELRARLAEAELFAMYTKANTLAREALRMRAAHRTKPDDQASMVEEKYKELRARNPSIRRGELIKLLEKDNDLADVDIKKLTRLVDKWNKALKNEDE